MEKTTRDIIQESLSKQIMDNNMWGIAYVAPRVGKIKITLNCLKPKDKVIIIYPETNIKTSWVNDIKKWKFKSKNIKYSTSKSFKKIQDPCDILVIDEIHTLSENQITDVVNYINKHKIQKVLGLSGTISEDTRITLENRLKLKIIVNYPIEQAIDDRIITDYRITVLTTPLDTNKNIKIKWSGGEFYTSEKMSFDRLTAKIGDLSTPAKSLKMLRLTRMSIIKKSASKIRLTKEVLSKLNTHRVLVFTGLTDVADSLGIPSYHSKNSDEKIRDEFLNGKLDKLAIVNKLNTGTTFNKLNTAVVNFFDSNAENMAQKISRITCMEYDNLDKVANIIIICSDEDVEKRWLNKSLSFFDQNKIKWTKSL